jgi:hypothetical protein
LNGVTGNERRPPPMCRAMSCGVILLIVSRSVSRKSGMRVRRK